MRTREVKQPAKCNRNKRPAKQEKWELSKTKFCDFLLSFLIIFSRCYVDAVVVVGVHPGQKGIAIVMQAPRVYTERMTAV